MAGRGGGGPAGGAGTAASLPPPPPLPPLPSTAAASAAEAAAAGGGGGEGAWARLRGMPGRARAWAVERVKRAARGAAWRARAFVEPLLAPLRLVYAYIAERIAAWIFAATLVILYTIVGLGVAVVTYLFLYHNFVPIIAFHRPLYFDFTRHEPSAVADFTGIERTWSPEQQERLKYLQNNQQGPSPPPPAPMVVAAPVLSPGHVYDFSLHLDLPDSPINDDIGMFMVTLSLYSWDGDLLANSSRPCRIRYRTDLLQKIWTLFWSLPLVFGIMEERQSIDMELLAGYIDTPTKPFGYAVISLSRQELQAYAADLHIEARLSGISYFCYYWFFTAMAVFVPLIFLAETWLVILTWLVIYFLLPGSTSTAVARRSATPLSSIAGRIPTRDLRTTVQERGPDTPGPATTTLASLMRTSGLEELGYEAQSPALPRPSRDRTSQTSESDEKTQAKISSRRSVGTLGVDSTQAAEEDEQALQNLLMEEIEQRLAIERQHLDEMQHEEEEPTLSDEGEAEEDSGAGVYPRVRRRAKASDIGQAGMSSPSSDFVRLEDTTASIDTPSSENESSSDSTVKKKKLQ